MGATAAALAALEVAVRRGRATARPGASLSGFMARHIEQPGSRHSKPAAVKTRSSPSASACSFTAEEPGTTRARMPGATCRPSSTAAAARRSSMRALVHEPMNTVSTAMSRIGGAGREAHVVEGPLRRLAASGSSKLSGSGTAPPIGTTWPGLVPQVTGA